MELVRKSNYAGHLPTASCVESFSLGIENQHLGSYLEFRSL